MDNALELLKKSFDMWIKALGLAWWDIEVIYYDDPVEILEKFADEDTPAKVICAFTDVRWVYGTARISVNLTTFVGLDDHKIDRIVVHELLHILVNEMREKEMCHEERVVTQLTKAFFWALDAVERGNEEE